MRVFVAGVSAHRQYISAFRSFEEIAIREGDRLAYRTGSRGDVQRTFIASEFLNNRKYDAILLCDLDQKFPKDTLERLRSHDKDMVSGHYMKRTTKALTSIWQYTLVQAQWPYIPYLDPPRHGLHRIAQTGMGCVLIKREVVEAVAEILPPGANPFEIGKLPEAAFLQANFGSDYRFFYLAQKLGFELWGDADVECPHASTMWLTRDTIAMLEKARKDSVYSLMDDVVRAAIGSHGMITQNALFARLQVLNAARETTHDPDQKKVIDGQIAENEIYLSLLQESAPQKEWLELWKNIYGWRPTHPQNVPDIQLPTFGNDAAVDAAIENRDKTPGGLSEEEAMLERAKVVRDQNAKKLLAMNAKNVSNPSYSTETGEETVIAE